jgi:DNA polymerase III subunit delta
MKLDARRLPGFLRDPGSVRAVLLYGDDAGLIRERAEALVRAVVGSRDDPFRVAELDRDSAGRLSGEMASLSLTGGRRVIRLREATDAVTGPVGEVLKGSGDGLLLLEAPGLAGRSRLRSLVENSPEGAAIGCYKEEGGALEDTIRSALAAHGVTVEPGAVSWLGSQLGADRGTTRQELEKLALYAGAGGHVDLAAAMACVGDLAALSLEDALFAATEGDLATTDRALALALAEGAPPVAVLRASVMHLQRLHRIRLTVESGVEPREAVRAARPPVFFRRVAAVNRALALWRGGALLGAMAQCSEAEQSCKLTAAPAEAICRETVMRLARRAAAKRREV